MDSTYRIRVFKELNKLPLPFLWWSKQPTRAKETPTEKQLGEMCPAKY